MSDSKIKEAINASAQVLSVQKKPLAVATVRAYWKSYESKPTPKPKTADKAGDIC